MISRRTGAILLVLLTLLIITAAILAPRVAQPLSYHQFADTRSWLTIPNFGDVASNLLFAIFGAWGLWFLATNRSSKAFLDPSRALALHHSISWYFSDRLRFRLLSPHAK